MEWNNLGLNIRNSPNCNDFTRPEPDQAFNVDISEELKFLKRRRLLLNHLADNMFRHNLQDCLNLPHSHGQETETSAHNVHDRPFLTELTKLIQLP